MLIPIDRPLIDGRNTREALLQNTTNGFVATHNQRRVLRLQPNNPTGLSGTPHIQAGVRVGQKLTIFCVNDADPVIIQDGGGVGTQLNGNWSVGNSHGDGSFLHVMWDGFRWWETGRGVGEASMSGLHAHAEGNKCIASGDSAHAEGTRTTASDRDCHSEGYQTTASQDDAHAQGNNTVASGTRSHAEGVGSIASGSGSHASGSYGKSDQREQFSQGAGKYVSVGDTQYTRFVLRASFTPNAGGDVIGLYGTVNGPIIPADSVWTFRALVSGCTVDAGEVCSWSVEGCIKRIGNATTICTIQAVNIIHVDDVSIILTAVVDDASDCLNLTVTDADAAAGAYHFAAVIHVTQTVFT